MSGEDLDAVHVALRDNESVGIGDVDGAKWARTADVGMATHLPYSRVLNALYQLEREARARKHPSGHDVWQALPR